MQTFDRRYSHIPPGTWWIRWVDGVVIDAGRRTVTVRLEPWPDPAITGDAIRMKEGGSHSWTISASNLGLFAVGDVFHDGRIARSEIDANRVRSVCDRAAGRDSVRRFTVNLPGGDLGDKALDDDYPGPRPGSWSPDMRPRFLSKKAYPNKVASDSRCRLLRADEGHVIVPASEMLRAFVAPHVRILRALFSSPLEEAVRTLIVQPPLAPSVPGRFRVDLLPGVPHDMAPYIANLLQTHNPDGFRDVSRLWACLDPPPTTRRFARLPALMPFSTGTFSFSAKCFEIFPGYFLACRVIAFDWPDARPIESSHLTATVGDLGGVAPPGEALLNPTPNVPFDPATDPGPTADEAPLLVEMPAVGLKPDLTRVARPRGGDGTMVMDGTDRREADTTAIGPTDPDSDAAAVVFVPTDVPADRQDTLEPPPASRFTRVLALLDELKPKVIASFQPVLPGSGTRLYGNVPLIEVLPKWVVDRTSNKRRPPVRSWTWVLDAKTGQRRPRTIMVLRIVLASGATVHWFEVEGEPPQAHAALLVRFAGDPDVEAVVAAITAGAGRLLVTGSDGGGSNAVSQLGIAAMTTYDHRPEAEGSLSGDHAAAVLRRFG